MKLVHVTTHLGGGVGRVLSQMARYRAAHDTGVTESFICLEAPEKDQFVRVVEATGARLVTTKDYSKSEALLREADIIQLEWWHHPLMIEWLLSLRVPGRLTVWSHTSGLHYPAFPEGLVKLPHRFLLTTAASKQVVNGGNAKVIPSSGGFDDIPQHRPSVSQTLRYGYIGSLNDAKLHPQIMEFLQAAGDISVKFYGDVEVANPLTKSPHVQTMGYTSDPASALAEMDILVYLLNPLHYGTTENALLEAMAAGVVPIVMNNPVEMSIVCHDETGMVVDSPAAFAVAINYLKTHPAERMRMADAASQYVRQHFSLKASVDALTQCYKDIMGEEKKPFDFVSVFGKTPFDWFCSGLGEYARFFADGAEIALRQERRQYFFLYEKSKSSLFHFFRYFPDDIKLKHWAAILEGDRYGI